MTTPLVLASRSPRRAALLEAAGIPFERGPFSDAAEVLDPHVAPPEAARRIAVVKAESVGRGLPGRLVLAADTIVFQGRQAFGKPAGAADARRMLRRLSGTTHQVATGVALWRDGVLLSDVALATVRFRPLGDAEIEAYVASGEPLDKAGAYAVQGGAAAFLERLDGDLDAVVGLPVRLVRALLARLTASPSV